MVSAMPISSPPRTLETIAAHLWTRENRSMKIRLSLILISSFALWAFYPSAAQTKADPATAKITALEAKWNDAYKRNDPAGMEALLADDFIITIEDGTTFSKSGYLAHTADSELRVQISDMTDLRVRVHGTLAIVTGAYHEKGTSKGKGYESHDRFTDVWIKGNSGWQVIASHYSIPSAQ
jgi:ketosteroid isomerase-like protein